MIDDQLSREFGQHLVEEVLNGRMTRRELLVRASIFGLSAAAIGSLLAACGSSTSSSASSAYTSAGIDLVETSSIWERQGIILQGDPGAWDEGFIQEISVIEDGGTWKAWYTGGYHGTNVGIGYATAPTAYGPWTKRGAGVSPTVLSLLTPGFETDANSDGIADNWTLMSETVGGTPTLSRVAGRTGGYAQRIQYTAQAGDTGKYISLHQLVAGAVVVGDTVEAEVYVKGSVSGGCTAGIDPTLGGSDEERWQLITPRGVVG